MPLVPNQELFEYRITRLLGQGAFGTVYLAHDTLLDRPVAIKELAIASQADATAIKRFLQEARVAGGLDHPNIITVYALKVAEPGTHYLVMEYVAGGSLRTLLQQRGPLQAEEAVRIAAEVCDGLAAVHAKGIVHRDIKPENVLLTQGGRAKVGDFGIAHVPQAADGLVRTYTGFQPGTLLYMSPEQVRGEAVDGRSDVYQVGLLLYEMLTGHHCIDLEAIAQLARETAGSNLVLFQARLYELLAEAVCEREPQGIHQIRPEVPGWIAEVVKVALDKRVERRPRAQDLARALRERQPVLATQAVPASAVDTVSAEAHVKLGLAYAEQGRLDEAIAEYQAALRLNPAAPDVHYRLGLAYEEQGRLDEALAEFQSAIRTSPNHADAYCGMGKVYYMQGRLGDAIDKLQRAVHMECVNDFETTCTRI